MWKGIRTVSIGNNPFLEMFMWGTVDTSGPPSTQSTSPAYVNIAYEYKDTGVAEFPLVVSVDISSDLAHFKGGSPSWHKTWAYIRGADPKFFDLPDENHADNELMVQKDAGPIEIRSTWVFGDHFCPTLIIVLDV